MNRIKKNQIAIYIIALMLVIVGYLSYIENKNYIKIGENNQNTNNIGDATLVNNNETLESAETNETIKENEEDEELVESKENNIEPSASNNIIDEGDEYFTNSKIEREKMYSQMLETYQKMLENTSITEEQKSIASNEITKINNTRNSIMICENLIEIKGFENAVILANGDSVNVVVKAKELGAEEIAQIQNIITREMKKQIENIHIMKK